MDRRRALASIVALAGPCARLARAERIHRLGVLSNERQNWDPGGAASRELAAQGFVEGRNLVLVERYLRRDWPKIERFASELVEAKVDAILTGGTILTRALLNATSTIPIVTFLADPVASGFAKSLRASGRNLTGLANGGPEVTTKLLDVARALVPAARRFVLFANPALSDLLVPAFEVASKAASLTFEPFIGEVEAVEQRIRTFRSPRDAMGFAHGSAESEAGAALAISRGLPLLGNPKRGYLAYYGHYFRDEERRMATITASILRGADPSKIPFELPDSEEFAVNRATARKLGLAIPYALQLKVNEYID